MKRGVIVLCLLLILFLSGCISLGPKVRECNVDKAVEFLIENSDEDIEVIKKTLSSRKYNCKPLAENSIELLPKGIRERAREMRIIDIEHATECAVIGNFEVLQCPIGARCGECLDDPLTDEVEGYNLVDPGEDIIDVRDVVLVANTIDDPCYLDSGDLNGDDLINVLDVVVLINFVMDLGGDDLTSAQECAADLNQDGIYNVLDVVSMINIILYEEGRDMETATISADWINTEACNWECTQHQDCEDGYFCHSGWDGEGYGPRFCAVYDNAYCENNPCGVGDGDCDYNDNWGDGTLGSNGCGPDMTCGSNHNLDNCNFGFSTTADCCVGDEPVYSECDNFYDTCGEIPVQINLDQSGSQNIQGVQLDICPDPFYPTEDQYEIISEELTAFNSWMWRVEFDGEPTDAASPCSCASLTGQCTRFIGLAITMDQSQFIQSGTTNLPIVQVNIQNPNFPINIESNYQDIGISGMLTTNIGQQITTTFNGLSETLCGSIGFTCEEGVSIWDIPLDFIQFFGTSQCSAYNEGDSIDCSGSVNGNDYVDNCGTCDADPSNDCVQDCNDVWDGDAESDTCGTCDSDPSNDCIQDCAGVWGGSSYEDDCGVCDFVSDCAGTWGGDAVVDNCGVCGGISEDMCGSCEFAYLWDNCYSIEDTIWLELVAVGLTGEIPPEIGQLTNLEILNLGENQLTGEIPSEIGQLTNLEKLYLYNNYGLTGEIPPEIGQLTNLLELKVTSNQLTGEIPSEIGNLVNLEILYLYNNYGLTGEIPPEIGNLVNLETLGIGYTHITGDIPSEIWDLTNLKDLMLGNADLTGEISPEIGQLTKLINLDLHGNDLTGEIPSEIGQLVNLWTLSLHSNQLTGEIPLEIWEITNLRDLWLQYNQLTGEIPPEIGQLTKLGGLMLNDNQLTGEIPPEIGNLDMDGPPVTYVRLSDNQLTGEIPSEICFDGPPQYWLHNNYLCPPYPECGEGPITSEEVQDTSNCDSKSNTNGDDGLMQKIFNFFKEIFN